MKNQFDYVERENNFSVEQQSCDPHFSNDNYTKIKHEELILNRDVLSSSVNFSF